MQEIINIIRKLRELSGNAQLEYLKDNKDTPLLKEVLQYTYNPNKIYHISDTKLNNTKDKFELTHTQGQSLDAMAWNEFKQYLDKFASQKGVKDTEIETMLSEFYFTYKNDELKLFEQILLKDLRINMGISSFNKVWADFYIVPQVMLAKKYEGKKPKNAYISRKFDGQRMYYLNGKFYSRTNKEINSEPIKHIIEQLSDFPQDKVLDGELIYFKDDSFKEDFQKTVALSGKEIWQNGCEKLYYVLFDIIDRDEFLAKNVTKPFKLTYVRLINNLRAKKLCPKSALLHTKYKNVLIAEQMDYNCFDHLSAMVNKFGWEGIMLRDADKPYQCKRTSVLQKIKKMQDDEFQLVRFNVGTGKYADTLGSITIILPTGETVDVGSGFSEEQRNRFWDSQNFLLQSGYFIKVQYFEKTKDKNGCNSLRFPVFLAFRDKNGEEFV